MNHQAKLLENIQDQINRLVEQLKEIEEEKEDLDEDEYEEMKNDTIDQLNEFREKLNEFQGKDLQSDAEKQRARIMKAVGEAYNQNELKNIVNNRKADENRAKIKEMIINNDDEGIIAKDVLKLISDMRADGCILTQDEKDFLNEFEGADFEKVGGENLMLNFLDKFSK